jgi:hypothetical protein
MGSTIRNCTIEDAVIERDAMVEDSNLKNSLIGERSHIKGVKGSVNVGDDSQVNGS